MVLPIRRTAERELWSRIQAEERRFNTRKNIMRVHDLAFKGTYEEQPAHVGEQVQVIVPETEIERDLLSWAILPHPETIADDSARDGYTFHYELGGHREQGLYDLTLTSRDASGKTRSAEIVAALGTAVGAAEEGRAVSFVPYWFISKNLHFQSDESYGGPRTAGCCRVTRRCCRTAGCSARRCDAAWRLAEYPALRGPKAGLSGIRIRHI